MSCKRRAFSIHSTEEGRGRNGSLSRVERVFLPRRLGAGIRCADGMGMNVVGTGLGAYYGISLSLGTSLGSAEKGAKACFKS